MQDFYVYLLLDPRKDNAPFYIGKGRGPRCYAHLLPNHTCSNKLKMSVLAKIREAGMEPLIEFAATRQIEDDAFDLEKKLILQYGRRDLGTGLLTNLTDGGEGTFGHIFSDERRQRISEALTGKKATDQQRKNQSIAAKNRKHSPMSDETKAKIREKATGRLHSDVTKKKISDLQSGQIRGPRPRDIVEKIAAAQRDIPRPHVVGQKRSEATCLAISKALTGKKTGPFSDERRSVMGKARAGIPQPLRSEIHYQHLVEANRRPRIITEQARQRMRDAQTRRRLKEKINETH